MGPGLGSGTGSLNGWNYMDGLKELREGPGVYPQTKRQVFKVFGSGICGCGQKKGWAIWIKRRDQKNTEVAWIGVYF